MKVNYKFTNNIFPSLSLKEEIIMLISSSNYPIKDIVSTLITREKVTKQAVYKSLRVLLSEEILVKHNKVVSINKVWISKLNKFVENSEEDLGVKEDDMVFDFSKKQTTIRFKSIESLDIYIGHLLMILADHFRGEPLFFFNHHEWFVYHRPLSEKYLYETFFSYGHKIFLTLGKNTPLSIDFKKTFSNTNTQIAIDESFNFPITDYFCIIGDFIITARYEKDVAQKIDKIMSDNKIMTDMAINKLRNILNNTKSSKIIINKNPKKASEIRNKLARNFVIRKNEF